MNTKANPGLLARLWAAITGTPTPAPAAPPRPAHPREIPNPNSPAGKRGIPAAAQTSTHIHGDPTITL